MLLRSRVGFTPMVSNVVIMEEVSFLAVGGKEA